MRPGSAITLLNTLTRRGIEMVALGDRLRYRPRSAMTPELAEQVRRCKPDLLAIVRNTSPGPSIGPEHLPADWRVEWEERAAIREYDGGQHRELAEAAALTEILARMRWAGVPIRPES